MKTPRIKNLRRVLPALLCAALLPLSMSPVVAQGDKSAPPPNAPTTIQAAAALPANGSDKPAPSTPAVKPTPTPTPTMPAVKPTPTPTPTTSSTVTPGSQATPETTVKAGSNNTNSPATSEPTPGASKPTPQQAQFLALSAAEQYKALESMTDEAEIKALLKLLSPERRQELDTFSKDLQAKENANKARPAQAALNTAVNFTAAGPLLPAISGPAAQPSTRALRASGTEPDTSGITLNKTATYNKETHKVDFTLEAFATGDVTTVTTPIPADIVLVLDQSGSMAEPFGTKMSYTALENKTNSDIFASLNVYVLVDGQYYRVKVESKFDGSIWKNVYTYTYTDSNNKTHRATSTGTNNSPPAGWKFYEGTETTISRLQALTAAVTSFVSSIRQQAQDKNVDHRIALVGFASANNNTEILTVPDGNAPIDMYDATDETYKSALVNANVKETLNPAVLNAISWLSAEGATQTDFGLEMAQKIFAQNPIPAGEKRSRVVVTFTDGSPTSSNGFETDVADAAISQAFSLKKSGVTSYTIGIFPGADPASLDSKPNQFLNYVSSNYPEAKSMDSPGAGGNKGYYLSADNPDGLNNVFKSISQQIGAATNTSLTKATVIKDAVMPQLDLPAGTAVTLAAASCTGKAGDQFTFGPETPAPAGVTATIPGGGGSVSVTGYDFSKNYVAVDSTTEAPRGRKLLIRFSAPLKAGFFGGNGVVTNQSDSSGVYLDNKMLKAFNSPTVNIPIDYQVMEKAEQSIYVSNSVDIGKAIYFLKKGDTNYQPDGLNNAYVDIYYTIKTTDATAATVGIYKIPAGSKTDASAPFSGKIVQPLKDQGYTVDVRVVPQDTGKDKDEGKSFPLSVYVFDPEIKTDDAELYLGESVDLTSLFFFPTPHQWVHSSGGLTGTPPDLNGSEPTLTLTPVYVSGSDPGSYSAGSIAWTKYAPTETSGFKVQVMAKGNTDTGFDITEYAQHTGSGTGTNPLPFTVKVKSCSLTISKAAVTGVTIPADQSFIFTVKDAHDNKIWKVAIQGATRRTIAGLPIGTYTVAEDTAWSWRYMPQAAASQTVKLVKDTPDQTLTFTNAQSNDHWLSGDGFAVNRFAGRSN